MYAKMPSTKADYVYDVLKKEIVEGRLAPGTRLRLTELASRYETSEMPVREALLMLRRDGLVEFKSHKGATVAGVSIKDLYDIVATGTYLQILAITEALPYHTERTISSLSDLNEQMKKTNVSSKCGELNNEFDQLLRSPCRNRFLKDEIDDIVTRFFSRGFKSIFELRPERKALAIKAHAAMIEAVKTKSVSRLQSAAMTNRDESLKAWRSVVDEVESKTTEVAKSKRIGRTSRVKFTVDRASKLPTT